MFNYCCCTGLSPERLEILHKHGYTAWETGFSGLTNAPEETILAMRDKAAELGMTCVSHNGMFPGDIKLLTGKDGYGAIEEYLGKTFAKAKPLGAPTIVLGSGSARRIPDDMSKEEAFERFAAVLSDVIAPAAKEAGVVVAIEELRREECNFINNCREAMELIRAVNKPEIQLLIDYYHSMLGGDKLEELASYGSAIRHVHIASPKNNRRYPTIDDLADCRGFFAALKSAGYTGAISLEGSDGGNFESAIAEAISVMKAAQV
ncbi:MAG: sugar phosphate isomerase/epimerase [Clostridia bacterium]|nr:sugar phosphate isomerase/epimerase [Clostridia bacterium]